MKWFLQQVKNAAGTTLGVLLAVVISGCTIMLVQGTAPDKAKLAQLAQPAGCAPFVMPTLKPIPELPDIPDSVINNKNATDTILINKIRELRNYSKEVNKQIQAAYEEQIKSCQ